MKKTVLICDRVKQEYPKLYEELEGILKQRAESGRFNIVTLRDYNQLSQSEQANLLKDINFFCFHTDTHVGHLVMQAFHKGIPMILLRGKDIDSEWRTILQSCGVGENIDLEGAKKMIYLVDEVQDIRGAFRWVSDFYHPLVEKKMNILSQSMDRALRG